MRKAVVATMSCWAMLLGGCATLLGPRLGSELVGRSATLEPARGQASTLTFGRDGTVTSSFGQRDASGRWWVRNRRLCFLWAGDFQECWPYAAPLVPGETETIRSDRGNMVRVTLL